MLLRIAAALALCCAFFITPAEAKHHHRHHHTHHRHHHRHHHSAPAAQITHPSTVVEHPAGCPQTAFCGCGAAVHVFGRPIRELWVAANWFKFARVPPAPGMVAVRRHHVFVLEAQLGRGLWLVYDANSGRHLTRIHARSIAGYTIVNPHSS